MKKSELRQLIKEEMKKVLKEGYSLKPNLDKKSVESIIKTTPDSLKKLFKEYYGEIILDKVLDVKIEDINREPENYSVIITFLAKDVWNVKYNSNGSLQLIGRENRMVKKL